MTLAPPLVDTLIKQLPPSASTLRLLDLSGTAGTALAARRLDLAVTVGEAAGENVYDAVVGCDSLPADDTLRAVLRALRPGGRLVVVDAGGEASAALVRRLEESGFTRILVEELTSVGGVLMRGEKPHVTADTLARVAGVAAQDAQGEFRGRYLHLLVRQTPNRPVWALKPGEAVEWHAVALAGDSLAGDGTPALLVFSSLPNAVAFMQPAVLAGRIHDVNKVGKFSRDAAQDWQARNLRVLVNPPLGALDGREIVLVPVDPASAETPDE
jgi:hypothetical protein